MRLSIYPEAAHFGKKIPKQSFYNDFTPGLRRLLGNEIDSVYWLYKFSAHTLNIAPGATVQEIQLFYLTLRQNRISTELLEAICRFIPYHILFLLEYAQTWQWRIMHRSSDAKNWYSTAWLNNAESGPAIAGLDLDAVYENFVRKLAGSALPSKSSADLEVDIHMASRITALQKLADRLNKKIKAEKQFNRRVLWHRELQKVLAELAALRS